MSNRYARLSQGISQPTSFDPIDIFNALPKPEGIGDLWQSQSDVLKDWFKSPSKKDTVIKLNTGAGKTLVGLLIAYSSMLETKKPSLFLVPNNQLVRQVVKQAEEVSIPVCQYTPGGLHPEFISGNKIMVASYQALFNGFSKFGVAGRGQAQHIGCIILDDAHNAIDELRDVFSLRFNKDHEVYKTLYGLAVPALVETGKRGTLYDMERGDKLSILEIPYWKIYEHIDSVHSLLSKYSQEDDVKFQWNLIKDHIEYCQFIFSSNEIYITPVYPPIHLLPSFESADRRVYMSATISDDSEVVRVFGANPADVASPITSRSAAGFGERLILIPGIKGVVRDYSKFVAQVVSKFEKQYNIVILAPSEAKAEKWREIATIVKGKAVDQAVEDLCDKDKKINGKPIVFANRYDGIDLPKDACRILILDDMPGGSSLFERYFNIIFSNSKRGTERLARRVEQGMGRGTRSSADYCAVILIGPDLTYWISQITNQELFTRGTRAQIDLGDTLSKDLTKGSEFLETVTDCLERDQGWISFHSAKMATLATSSPSQPPNPGGSANELAGKERRAYRFWLANNHDQALATLEQLIVGQSDESYLGWILQLMARIAFHQKNHERARELQERAYAANSELIKPTVQMEYRRIINPGNQAGNIHKLLKKFKYKTALSGKIGEIIPYLSYDVSSNLFEESVRQLGEFLGFAAQRPDNETSNGPDVVWLLNDGQSFVIEAKSRKKADNELVKGEHGQALDSSEWFKNNYPDKPHTTFIIHPNASKTESTNTHSVRALTLDRLILLAEQTQKLYDALAKLDYSVDMSKAIGINRESIQEQIIKMKLSPENLISEYSVDFRE